MTAPSVRSPSAGSSATTPLSVFARLHDSLNHVLDTGLAGGDAPLPASLGLGQRPAATAAETEGAWRALREIVDARRQQLEARKERDRGHAATTASRKKSPTAASAASKPPASASAPATATATATTTTIKTPKQPSRNGTTTSISSSSNGNGSLKPPQPPPTQQVPAAAAVPRIKGGDPIKVVKTLDLSGANRSPVLTAAARPHLPPPPPAPLPQRLPPPPPPPPTTTSRAPPNFSLSGTSVPEEVLDRLHELPMLETLDPSTRKCAEILRWLDVDDGRNDRISSALATCIIDLQNAGKLDAAAPENGKRRRFSLTMTMAAARGRADLDETLDERLAKEGQLKGRRRRRRLSTSATSSKPRVKREGSGKGKKRPLASFTVESDEEVNSGEDGAGEEEEEAEYSGDSNESDSEEAEWEAGGDPNEPPPPRSRTRNSRAAAGTTESEANAAKVSPPPAAPGSPTQSNNAKEQLRQVAARLREEELTEPSPLPKTYLSYDNKKQHAQSAAVAIKAEEAGPAKTKAVVPQKLDFSASAQAGTSSSTAIVLEDSDDEDDDDDVPLSQVIVATKPSPKAAPAKPVKSAKTKAAASPPKKKPAPRRPVSKHIPDDSEEDEDGDEEMEGPHADEDSATDEEEQDMFDLNEEDVYMVESILEMKPGRTIAGRGGRSKEADLFLVKWEGYDELTWEPDANIPKRIIQFYHDRERGKKSVQFQIDKFLERKVAKNSTTGKDEVIYLIQWKGMQQAYWEVRSNLPEKTVVWLEKTSRASLGRAPVGSGAARKKVKR